MSKLRKDSLDIKNVLGFALMARTFLMMIGYISYALSANKNPVGDLKFDPKYFFQAITALNYSDVTWYLQIANDGYTVKPFSVVEKANWAFYPLWPMAMRLGSFLTGGNTFVAGLILANLIFLIAIVYLYKLINIDFSKKIAYLATILVIIFPASYFYSRPGPESLFLLLNVLSLFFAKKDRWFWAGLYAGLATVTRLQGILLLFPLLFIYYQQYRQKKSHNINALSLLLVPIFYTLFLLHLYSITGNFLASFGIQQTWDSRLEFPFKAMIQFVLSPNFISYYGWDLSPVSFLFMILGTALVIAIARSPKIPKEYLIYTVLHLFLILARNNLQGTLRFMLPIFPLYIAIALSIERRKTWYDVTFYGFIALQTAYFIAFINQYNFAHT